MTKRERILESLLNGEAYCDDCLAWLSDVHPRQTVNRICRQNLAHKQLITRNRENCPVCGKFRIVNRLAATPDSPGCRPAPDERPWYWVGNIEDRIVDFLRSRGLTALPITKKADRETAREIMVRTPGGGRLWLTVKGYPVQNGEGRARRWFSQALFGLLLARNDRRGTIMGMGLPAGFETYAELAGRVSWLKKILPLRFFWVEEDGAVNIE